MKIPLSAWMIMGNKESCRVKKRKRQLEWLFIGFVILIPGFNINSLGLYSWSRMVQLHIGTKGFLNMKINHGQTLRCDKYCLNMKINCA